MNRSIIPLTLLLLGCRGASAQQPPLAPEPGERHLRNIRQLTFGGNNAEAYFSPDGRRLIFQRQERVDAGCDQQYTMNVDGSDLRRVSNGEGRTTCGYFYEGGRRILYSSTFEHGRACPPPPDRSQGYVWPLSDLRDLHRARRTGAIRSRSPGTMPTTRRPPSRPTAGGWSSPAPATATSSSTP